MSYPNLTPYDILDVNPNATRDQLKKAYEQALRKRKYSAAKVTQAYNDLRNVRKRLEFDLFVINSPGKADDIVQFVSELEPCKYIQDELEPLTIPIEKILLSNLSTKQYFLDIPDCPYQVVNASTQPEPQKVLPVLPFPW